MKTRFLAPIVAAIVATAPSYADSVTIQIPATIEGGASTAADVALVDAGGYYTGPNLETALAQIGAGPLLYWLTPDATAPNVAGVCMYSITNSALECTEDNLGAWSVVPPGAHAYTHGAGSSDALAVDALATNCDLGLTTVSDGAGSLSCATLGVTGGGTGATTLTNHGVLLGQGTGAVVVTAAGPSGYVLTAQGASADPVWAAAAGGGIGGSTTQVQFNDSGAFSGDAGMTYDKTGDRLTVGLITTTAAYSPDLANALNLATGRLTIGSGGVDTLYNPITGPGPYDTFLSPVTNAHGLLLGGSPVSTYDLTPGVIGIWGLPAQAAAATHLVGGDVQVRGGAGASGSSGNADGGDVLLDGGLAYGTGHAGQVKVGATRGNLQLVDPGTKPTCSSTYRGAFWIDYGAGGVADTIEVCGKSAADTYSWVALATF